MLLGKPSWRGSIGLGPLWTFVKRTLIKPLEQLKEENVIWRANSNQNPVSFFHDAILCATALKMLVTRGAEISLFLHRILEYK